MVNQIWQLQLFADAAAGGGEGAAAAPAGVEGADAGHARLKELGVPEARIRSNRGYAPQEQQPSQSAEEAPARMTWEEIRKDPEYSGEISKIVRERLKNAGAAQEAMNTLMPWLKTVAQQQGLDPENIDYQALVKSAGGEYARLAAQQGITPEVARQLDQQQRQLDRQKLDLHMQRLVQQGQQLKAAFPQFDLGKELQNEIFSRLVSPQMGMSVEDAYHAVHAKEIQAAAMQVAAQKTAQQISNAIRSGSHRPDETGVNPRSPNLTTFDYTKMNKAEREALKKRIYRGERILPGQI